MRIGFDIDGVLADFTTAYQAAFVQLTGKNLFEPDDARNPPVWDWPEHRGYTKKETRQVWDYIKDSPDWWTSLAEEDGMSDLRRIYPQLVQDHDVYFITNRVGQDVKWQSEVWLATALNNPLPSPTVLLSIKEKGFVAHGLRLDVFIDDNLENVVDIVIKTSGWGKPTRTYLLDRSYNRDITPVGVTRVKSVHEMLTLEGLVL